MIDRNVTVGQVAATVPKAMEYFKELGVDYCCGGNQPLRQVVADKSLSEEAVFARLEQLEQQARELGQRQDFRAMSAQELSDYIVDTHHAYLRRVMPEITQLLGAVMRAHGAQHRELFQVGQLYGRLRGELEQHLIREELVLFPALSAADGEGEAKTLAPEIIHEHEAAGEILAQLRSITGDYTVPSDGCATYETVYRMLTEMEDDLHRHIHLENNILLTQYDVR